MKEVSFRLATNKKASINTIKMIMADEDYQTMLENDDILISSFIISVDGKFNKVIYLCNLNVFIEEHDKNKQYQLKIEEYKDEIHNLKEELSEAILFN